MYKINGYKINDVIDTYNFAKKLYNDHETALQFLNSALVLADASNHERLSGDEIDEIINEALNKINNQ